MFVGACGGTRRIWGGLVGSLSVVRNAGSQRATRRLTRREIDLKAACKAFPMRVCELGRRREKGGEEGFRGSCCQELYHVEVNNMRGLRRIDRDDEATRNGSLVVLVGGLSACGKEEEGGYRDGYEPRVRGTEANWRHGRCSGNIPATEQTVKRSSRVVVKTPGRRN